MVQLNPVPVSGAKKIPVPFDGNFSPKFPHKLVSVPGPSLWYRCAAWKMSAGGDEKEGKRVSCYFPLSFPSSLRPCS